jgi:hypothetical protein
VGDTGAVWPSQLDLSAAWPRMPLLSLDAEPSSREGSHGAGTHPARRGREPDHPFSARPSGRGAGPGQWLASLC